MNLRNLLCSLIALGIIAHTGGFPCALLFGDYPYPEDPEES